MKPLVLSRHDRSSTPWRALGRSFSDRLESFARRVGQTRHQGSLVALVVACIIMLCAEWRVASTAGAGPSLLHSVLVRAGIDLRLNSAADGPSNWEPNSYADVKYTKFSAIKGPKTMSDSPSPRHLANSPTRRNYAKLAGVYLKPFPKIVRSMYMDFLEGSVNGTIPACSGCFLVQVKKKQVWVYDPHQVRSVMAQFREIRMREALHWVARAVEAGAVDNTEFVVSTTDGVVSTFYEHEYRMAPPEAVARPIFTLTHCNCSANIPFPMMVTDLMRRGFPDKFWQARSGSLSQWDKIATDRIGSQKHETQVWARKKPQAVFRGSIRIPAFLANASDYDTNCHNVGRTALMAQAEAHVEKVEKINEEWAKRFWIWSSATWPLVDSVPKSVLDATTRLRKYWSGAEYLVSERQAREAGRDHLETPLLDVQLSGKCGNRTYKSDKLNMEEQSTYRYTVHVEGNGFWADRLAVQLFGSSAIIKQVTPCGMFFEPLLRGYEHYIPVDYHFRDIVSQVEWARENDYEVRQIVENARSFSGNYLTVAGIQTYADEILAEYTRHLDKSVRDNIRIHPHAVKLFPINR